MQALQIKRNGSGFRWWCFLQRDWVFSWQAGGYHWVTVVLVVLSTVSCWICYGRPALVFPSPLGCGVLTTWYGPFRLLLDSLWWSPKPLTLAGFELLPLQHPVAAENLFSALTCHTYSSGVSPQLARKSFVDFPACFPEVRSLLIFSHLLFLSSDHVSSA